MPHIKHKMVAELDPTADTVAELYSVIVGMLIYHQGQEVAVLRGVIESAAGLIKQLQKGTEAANGQKQKGGENGG